MNAGYHHKHIHRLAGSMLLFTSLAVLGLTQQETLASVGTTAGLAVLPETRELSLYVRPDLYIGKFGLGLDSEVKFALDSGEVSFAPWIKPFDRIRFISWGNDGGKPLYFRAGNIESATIGTGILVDHYSNLTTFDTFAGNKRLGLVLDVDLPFGGFESVYRDAPLFTDTSKTFSAYRVYAKPFKFITTGVTFAKDNTDTYVTGEHPNGILTAGSLDIEFPVGGNLVIPYIAGAKFLDKGNGTDSDIGLSTGIRGGFSSFGTRFEYKTEVRYTPSDFIPGIFNYTYETEKAEGWIANRPTGESTVGIMGMAKFEISSIGLSFLGQMEDYRPYENDPHEVLELAPRITIDASLSDKILGPLSQGRLKVSSRYDGVLGDSEADSCLKTKLDFKTPLGVLMSLNYQTVFPKQPGETPKQTYGLEASLAF